MRDGCGAGCVSGFSGRDGCGAGCASGFSSENVKPCSVSAAITFSIGIFFILAPRGSVISFPTECSMAGFLISLNPSFSMMSPISGYSVTSSKTERLRSIILLISMSSLSFCLHYGAIRSARRLPSQHFRTDFDTESFFPCQIDKVRTKCCIPRAEGVSCS